jgi:hypothetical protein
MPRHRRPLARAVALSAAAASPLLVAAALERCRCSSSAFLAPSLLFASLSRLSIVSLSVALVGTRFDWRCSSLDSAASTSAVIAEALRGVRLAACLATGEGSARCSRSRRVNRLRCASSRPYSQAALYCSPQLHRPPLQQTDCLSSPRRRKGGFLLSQRTGGPIIYPAPLFCESSADAITAAELREKRSSAGLMRSSDHESIDRQSVA